MTVFIRIFCEIMGVGAAVTSTIAFLPQAIYTVRTKDTASISLASQTIFFSSVVMWLIYGIYLVDWPIITSNIVCVILSGIILVYKVIEVVQKKKNKQK